MDPTPETAAGWGWIQTTFAVITGMFTAVFGAAFWHQSQRMDTLDRKADSLKESTELRLQAGDDRLWAEIATIRALVAQHQNQMAEYHIANATRLGQLVSRDDLRAELAQLLSAIKGAQ